MKPMFHTVLAGTDGADAAAVVTAATGPAD